MQLELVQHVVEQLDSFEGIGAPFAAIFTDEFAAVLDDADFEGVDCYEPVVQMADSSTFARDWGTLVLAIGVAE